MAEEVIVEIEAVQAVYGNDCHVIQQFPPHLNVHIKPRTADDSSQQFVEAVLAIRSGPQYPKEPPNIDILESKGLDENRQAHLISSIQVKAQQLSSCLMLIALCEEAVEILSNMNHPEGNCPLCLYPLFPEDGPCDFLPFMKLMSCFHCFHSECIIRWWKWLQELNETNLSNSFETTVPASRDLENRRGISASLESSDVHGTIKQHIGNCPVCRKAFDAKDIEHVLDLLGTGSSQLSSVETSTNDDEKEFLQSDAEKNRRQKFEAVLKLQEENSGLIEPKKHDVLLPGMFLPVSTQPTTSDETTVERENGDSGCNPTDTDLSSSANKSSTSENKNSSTRKQNRVHNPKKPMNVQSSRKQWIKKEKYTPD